MKKHFPFITGLFLALFLYSTSAHAVSVFPLTPAEIASPVVSFPNGVSSLLPPFPTAHVPSTGTASRAGIARNMIARVGGFKGIATVGIVALAGYAAWVDSHSSDFPISYKLLHPDIPPNEDFPVGFIVTASDGHNYKITGPPFNVTHFDTVVGSPVSSSIVYNGNSTITVTRVATSNPSYSGDTIIGYHVTGTVSTYPVTVTTDPVSVPPAVSNDTFGDSLGKLYPEVLPEVDNYIKDNPSSVQLPSDLAQKVQDAVDSEDPSSVHDTDLDGIPDSDDPDIDGDGIPNSEDSDADGDGVPDADVPSDDEIDISSPQLPELHSIDLTPLLNVGAAVNGKFPFSLLSTVSAMATSLFSTSTAPVFTIHFPSPFDYDWIVSLERWDSWATLLRFLIGAGFLVAVSMSIMRRWV